MKIKFMQKIDFHKQEIKTIKMINQNKFVTYCENKIL